MRQLRMKDEWKKELFVNRQQSIRGFKLMLVEGRLEETWKVLEYFFLCFVRKYMTLNNPNLKKL